MRFDGRPSIKPLAFFLALFVLIVLTMVYGSALGYPPPVGVWASLSIVGFLLAFVAFAYIKVRRAVKSGVWDLGIKPEPKNWWQYIPERPWPLWIRVLNIALIGASMYAWVMLGGLLGFLVGLFALFVAVPVFFAWQWLGWRARQGPRTRLEHR